MNMFIEQARIQNETVLDYFKALSQHLSGENEENRETLHLGQSIIQPRFKQAKLLGLDNRGSISDRDFTLIYYIQKSSRTHLSHTKWIPRTFFLRAKRPEPEANHSILPNAQVNNAHALNTIQLHGVCLIKSRGEFFPHFASRLQVKALAFDYNIYLLGLCSKSLPSK